MITQTLSRSLDIQLSTSQQSHFQEHFSYHWCYDIQLDVQCNFLGLPPPHLQSKLHTEKAQEEACEGKIKIKSRDLKWHICTEARFFLVFSAVEREVQSSGESHAAWGNVLHWWPKRKCKDYIQSPGLHTRYSYKSGAVNLQMVICCIHTVAALPVCGLLG